MTDEAQIESVALFYFFSLMDESTARQATFSTLVQCRKHINKLEMSAEKIPSAVVYCTNKMWDRFKKLKLRGHSSISFEAGWLVSSGVDVGIWKEFQKDSDPSEFLAVIWSQILKFSDEQISEGLGVTEGTVRHRVGRGLRVLGQLRGVQ